MTRKTRNKRSRPAWRDYRRGGFSLIELLLVLVILATLTAIVVPKFTKRSEQAKVTAAGVEIGNIEQALDTFALDSDRFPTTEEGLEALVTRPANVKKWSKVFTRGVPKDPWGNPYVYIQPGQHDNDYDLYSYGPDGAQGGGDDIDNWSER